MTVGRARLGTLDVSRLGLGAMVLTRSFGSPDLEESAATFDAALDLGIDFVDTADCYAGGENEAFVGRLIAGRRERVVLATKFGLVADGVVDGRPERVGPACEASLRRLGTDFVDLYYLHRVDPDVPLEETVGAMGDLVQAGKVRHLGLCEVGPADLEAACSVHPITALESEWSLWARQIEAEILPAARRLGVGVVPYSPLGRGFLTGALRRPVDDGADLRGADPRLQGENLQRNLALVEALEAVASGLGATAAQVALAWLMAAGGDVVPIPGMERRAILAENAEAASLELPPDALARLDGLFRPGAAAGDPGITLMRAGVRGSGRA